MKRFWIVIPVILSLCSAALAGPRLPLQSRIFAVIRQYWSFVELRIAAGPRPASPASTRLDRAHSALLEASADLAEEVVASGGDALPVLSAIYRSLPVPARTSLHETLRHVRAELVRAGRAESFRGAFDTYFPGYGYAEPGYAYRKGLELAREPRGSTWVSEDKTIQASASAELEISASLLPHFRELERTGAIRNLVVHRARVGLRITFEASQNLVIKTRRRFEVSKIWFELKRAKGDAWWTTGPWEVVGRTYEIVDEPTGDVELTEVV